MLGVVRVTGVADGKFENSMTRGNNGGDLEVDLVALESNSSSKSTASRFSISQCVMRTSDEFSDRIFLFLFFILLSI